MERLAAAGIAVAVALAPIIPGITDGDDSLAAVLRAARDAGATRAWCRLLELRPGTREHFQEALARDWPAIAPALERRYERPYAPAHEQQALRQRLDALRDAHGLGEHDDPPAAWFPRQMTLFEPAA